MSRDRINAIVPWFGGKRTLAPAIAAELPQHRKYVEPFCGSCAVLFAKQPAVDEIVNDMHGGLICLARVLADDLCGPRLYERLQRTLVCDELLSEAQARIESCEEIPWLLRDVKYGENPWTRRADANMTEYAYWYFLACWQARNGTAGTARQDYQLAVRWTNDGGAPSVRWKRAVESIPVWHERLRSVVILRRDGFQVIERVHDDPQTVIYVDPPYCRESRSWTKNGAGSKYLHEFRNGPGRDAVAGLFSDDEPDDHERLRDLLARFRRARVVVSYYDCARVRDLYAAWTVCEHTRHKHLHMQNRRGAERKEAPEVLLINGPSLVEQPERTLFAEE